MTSIAAEAAPAEAAAAPPPRPPRGPRPVRIGGRLLVAVVSFVALIALALAGLRVFVTTATGHAVLERQLEGLRLGPIGRLHIEGLEGDPLSAFRLRRLTIRDARGVWLDGRDLAMRWDPLGLLERRVHARSLTVGDLYVARRPELEKRPPAPPSKPPVSVKLDAMSGRLRTGSALTVAAGDWNVQGALDFRRSGRTDAVLHAGSRLHAGDGVDGDLKLTDAHRLSLKLRAVEAAGGAIAGGLGLPADQPFSLTADGVSTDAGGHVVVDSRSGNARPVWADGRWTAGGGGHVEAHVVLAASRLLQPFVPRVGPRADAVLDILRSGAGRDFDLTVTGEATRLHARGPADFTHLSTPGVQVDASTRDLAAWFHPPPIGPAQVSGVLKGSIHGFTIDGRAVAQNLDEVGLKVARLSGPLKVELANGEWRVRTDVQGEGASGDGVLPALLGPRPTAHIDLSFLKDRRLLFRELHVAGTYARVDATGAQDLFGGLGFQGTFTAPSLKGVRPGAGGSLVAAWKASAPRHSEVWTLSLDAHGQGFASGLGPELDRLLGPAPRLTGAGTFDPDGLHVASATLVGAAARATATGRLGVDKRLGFDLAWTAAGPFAVGPVEVRGAMTGRGRLVGTIGEPEADLEAQLASLDFGRLVVKPAQLRLAFTRGAQALTGRVALSGPSNYGPAHAQAGFAVAEGGLDLTGIDADAGGVKLGGAVALRDSRPSSADLTLLAGPGAFLAGGRLSGAVRMAAAPGGGQPRATVTLDGRDLRPQDSAARLDRLQLNATGPADRLNYRLVAEGVAGVPFAWTGDGELAAQGAGRRLTLSGSGRVHGTKIATEEPGVIAFGPDGTSARLRLSAANGHVSVDGAQTGPPGHRRLDAHVVLAKFGFGALDQDFRGRLDADLVLHGQGPTLGGRLQAQLSNARSADALANSALDGKLTAELGGDRIRGAAEASNASGLKSHVAFDLPAQAAADPFHVAVVRDRPLTGSVAITGEVRPIFDLFGGAERQLSGAVDAQAQLSGTLNDLRAVGRADLRNGAFEDLSTGLKLRDLQVSALLSREAVQVASLAATDGAKGRISGAGRVSLTPDGASSFDLNLKGFQLIDNEFGKAQATGKVSVTRDAKGHARLAGALAVDRADISAAAQAAPGVVRMDVVEVNRKVVPGGMQAEPAAGPPQPSGGASLIALDVALAAPRGVFVRGRGIDAELSLDAHVGGTVAAPLLTGEARFVRGAYDFSGKRFDFDQSSVVHLASHPDAIRLDLTAERNDPSLDARIRITGTAASPVIALTSAPVLPQDEILSRVLFGVSASQLSGFEAAELASALASLATGGGFDVLGSLRQFAGLDRLTLGGGTGSGASVSGGKYLTPNIYLELIGAGTQRGENQQQLIETGRTGSSASIEFRVRKNLSLIGQVWTGGDSRLSVQFRKTFGQPTKAVPKPPATSPSATP